MATPQAGRLTSVDLPNTFATANPTFAWRLDGLIAARTWANGAAATFSYDGAKRPIGLTKDRRDDEPIGRHVQLRRRKRGRRPDLDPRRQHDDRHRQHRQPSR